MQSLGEMKKKLKQLTDNESEAQIKDSQICCFIDMAMKRAHKLISTLNRDYFISCEDIAVAAGQESVDLPSDINGTKIKKVQWVGDKDCCDLPRLGYDCQDCDKPAKKPKGYQFFNKKGEGAKLYLKPATTGPGTLRVIYERKPCDIDETTPEDEALELSECCDYIFSYALMYIYMTEKNPLLQLAIGQVNEAERLMLESMSSGFQDDSSCQLEFDNQWRGYVDEYGC